MLRKALVLLGVGALTVTLAASAAAAPANTHAQEGKRFTVVEHADTDTVVDLGAAGDSLGDTLTFGNPIYNAANTQKIGRDEGVCFRTNPGLAWECTWSTILSGGSLTVQGPFNDDLSDSVLAITGGTGIFRNARGEMTLHARNAAGTAFDFIFRVDP